MMILQFQFALQHTIITARTTAKPNDRFGFNTNYLLRQICNLTQNTIRICNPQSNNSRRNRRKFGQAKACSDYADILYTLNFIVPRITCITRIWQAKACFFHTNYHELIMN